MDPERWQKLKEPFYTALDMHTEERLAFLQKEFGDAPELYRELETLLQAHQNASTFMESSAFEQVQFNRVDATPLTRIGPYRIVRELGCGGMGVVYLAFRDDDVVKKRVALKLIRAGMTKESIEQRFLLERQALATLEHPNIARFLDGGFTDDGRPYYVMEYVEGEPINRFCDSHRLTVPQRLRLFCRVCAAVHYAHQNLIVHRDLKPDNVLVLPSGMPKLLDFGIAKIIRPELSPRDMIVTREHLQVLTPAYASPEQIRGTPITTASDVYALGVLLYELLTGHRPYRFSSHTPQEIERVVCEQQPERPSTAVTRIEEIETEDGTTMTLMPESIGKTRDEPPAKLKRRLAGDLDNIVLMAMRKEPHRRYASVEQFAEDIRRHLNGFPVIARPTTLRYRTGKLVKRYKTGVAAVAVSLIFLLAGIIGTSWQAHVAKIQREKAERRFSDVRNLANALIFDVHDAIENLPGATAARKVLVSRTLEYLDILARESGDDPGLQLELAWAYQRVGNVQGNPNDANLGDISGALTSYRKGMALAEKLAVVQPDNPEVLRVQAVLHEKLSDVRSWSGDLPEAIEDSKKSLDMFERLAAFTPSNPKARRSVAISHIKLGDILGNPNFPNAGHTDEALQHYQQALSILDGLRLSDATDATTRRYLGLIHERIATIYQVNSNLAAALDSYQTSLNIRKQLAADSPTHYDMQRDLAVAYEKMGDIHRAFGRPAEALKNYRASLNIFEELQRADPENSDARRSLCFSYEHLGDVLAVQGQLEKALSFYRKSLSIRANLVKSDPLNRKDSADLGRTLFQLAGLSVKSGNLTAARNYTRQLLQMQRRQADSPKASAYDLNNYAWSLMTCEPASLRDPAVALTYAKKAVEKSRGADANILDTLARAYFHTGDTEQAIETAEKALALLPENASLRGELQAALERFRAARER